jgi:hypothetical protein
MTQWGTCQKYPAMSAPTRLPRPAQAQGYEETRGKSDCTESTTLLTSYSFSDATLGVTRISMLPSFEIARPSEVQCLHRRL